MGFSVKLLQVICIPEIDWSHIKENKGKLAINVGEIKLCEKVDSSKGCYYDMDHYKAVISTKKGVEELNSFCYNLIAQDEHYKLTNSTK